MLYDHSRSGHACPTWLSLVVLLGMLALLIILRGALMAETRAQVRAPEFPEGMQWLNTATPLRLADLRGKVVLLDIADLATGEVSTLELKGLPLPGAVAGFSDTSVGTEEVIQVAAQQVQAGAAGRLRIDLQLPEGYHLNPQAPLSYRVRVSGTGIDIAEQDRQFNATAPPLPLAIPFQTTDGTHQATVDIDLTFYYCREDNTGVCVIQSVRWLVPLRAAPDGTAAEPVVSYKAEAPVLQKQL